MSQPEQTTIMLPQSGTSAKADWSDALTQLARPARIWAYAVVVLACLNFALAVWTAIRTGDSSHFFTHQLFLPFLAVSYALLGRAVISRRPRNPIGWIFLVVGTLFLIVGLAASVIDGATVWASVSPALLDLAYWSGNWTWLPAQFLPLTFVFLLFPDGHLPSRRWRFVGWSAGVGLLLLMFGLAAHPGPVSDWGTTANPYGIAGTEDILNVVINVGGILMLIGAVGSILAIIVRFRRSRGAIRAQMKWLVFAAVVGLAGAVLAIPLWRSGYLSEPQAMELSIVLTNVMTLGIAAAATVAIVSYRLYDIDVIINRTLVYTIMTGVIVLIYALVVSAAGLVFESQANGFVAILATALVALVFQPIRSRLQQGVNRLLYGQRDEPFEVLVQLGQRLEQMITPEAVYPVLVETVARTMRLPYAAIDVRQDGQWQTVESFGRAIDDLIDYDLTYQGQRVGRLRVARRSPDEAFSPSDERLLRNIARQAGAAVYNAQLTDDLQRSRQQIIAGREEERRRLRRDLHDGLGPSLASLLMQARVLRRLVDADPSAAEALAEEMQSDIRRTIEDIRRVVHELRPPALDDLGLVAAINVMAAKISRSDGQTSNDDGLCIDVHAPAVLPPLPAAVEVAAYRIVQEALTNVVHHAHARYATVCVWIERDLYLEVTDDGIGLNGGRDGGLGLQSMRERAAELGGDCSVSRRFEGGTIVRANLPVGNI